MKLITEHTSDVRVLSEESKTGKGKKYFIEGIFLQSDKQNKNGRIYPLGILGEQVSRYNEKYIKTSRSLGELGHPDNPTINLDRVSHIITELNRDGKNFIGRAKIMNTPMGEITKSFIEEGVGLGVSSRGMGSVKKNRKGISEVQKDFILNTVDIVADPSAPDAFVEGILESKEWIWDNGMIREKEIEDIKKTITESKLKAEKTAILAFEKFMSKISNV